jgi:serine/tyrosine/threonine adenylyltransferase
MSQNAASDCDEIYEANWLSGMRAKLGIFNEELEDAVKKKFSTILNKCC